MLGDIVGELILKPLFHVVGYATGKPIVRLLTLGRLHVSSTAEPDREEKRTQRWYSVTFTHEGKRYVNPEVVSLVGMLVWVAIIVVVVLVARRS